MGAGKPRRGGGGGRRAAVRCTGAEVGKEGHSKRPRTAGQTVRVSHGGSALCFPQRQPRQDVPSEIQTDACVALHTVATGPRVRLHPQSMRQARGAKDVPAIRHARLKPVRLSLANTAQERVGNFWSRRCEGAVDRPICVGSAGRHAASGVVGGGKRRQKRRLNGRKHRGGNCDGRCGGRIGVYRRVSCSTQSRMLVYNSESAKGGKVCGTAVVMAKKHPLQQRVPGRPHRVKHSPEALQR